MAKNNRPIRLKLSQLRTHPRQASFNPPCSPAEDEALREDLAKNGQREAIIVLPAGNRAELPGYVVLDGHRRCAALKANRAKEAIVLVRHDLIDADANAVESIFLAFNKNRRHLDVLAIAVNLVRQGQIERRLPSDQSDPDLERAVTNRLTEYFPGTSKRNGQRYVKVALADERVRQLYRDGRLPLNLAARVGGLPRPLQSDFLARLAVEHESSKAAGIAKDFLTPSRAYVRPCHATKRAITAIGMMESLAVRVEKLISASSGSDLLHHLPAIEKIDGVVKSLLALAAKSKRRRPASSVIRDPARSRISKLCVGSNNGIE